MQACLDTYLSFNITTEQKGNKQKGDFPNFPYTPIPRFIKANAPASSISIGIDKHHPDWIDELVRLAL